MSDDIETPSVEPSIYDIFATSQTAGESGKWFEFSPTISFKLRRLKSKFSRRARERLEQPYKRMMKNGELPQDLQEELVDKQIAEAIIVDWKGITDTKGQPMPYSKEAAMKLIKALPDLRDEIAGLSMRMDSFRDEETEEIVKN